MIPADDRSDSGRREVERIGAPQRAGQLPGSLHGWRWIVNKSGRLGAGNDTLLYGGTGDDDFWARMGSLPIEDYVGDLLATEDLFAI